MFSLKPSWLKHRTSTWQNLGNKGRCPLMQNLISSIYSPKYLLLEKQTYFRVRNMTSNVNGGGGWLGSNAKTQISETKSFPMSTFWWSQIGKSPPFPWISDSWKEDLVSPSAKRRSWDLGREAEGLLHLYSRFSHGKSWPLVGSMMKAIWKRWNLKQKLPILQ